MYSTKYIKEYKHTQYTASGSRAPAQQQKRPQKKKITTWSLGSFALNTPLVCHHSAPPPKTPKKKADHRRTWNEAQLHTCRRPHEPPEAQRRDLTR